VPSDSVKALLWVLSQVDETVMSMVTPFSLESIQVLALESVHLCVAWRGEELAPSLTWAWELAPPKTWAEESAPPKTWAEESAMTVELL
jgi:hypothetical protein